MNESCEGELGGIKVVCLYECLNVRYDFGGSAGSVMFGLGMGWEVSVELGFGVG